MQERIIELEKRSAFQEDAIAQLNDVVIAQQRQIDELTKQVAFLREALSGGDLVKRPEDEIPPPHY